MPRGKELGCLALIALGGLITSETQLAHLAPVDARQDCDAGGVSAAAANAVVPGCHVDEFPLRQVRELLPRHTQAEHQPDDRFEHRADVVEYSSIRYA